MIDTELLDSVRFPDEIDCLYFDAPPYDKIVEYLKYSIKISNGEEKKFHQDTLAELEHRWKERQVKANRLDISTKKVRSNV